MREEIQIFVHYYDKQTYRPDEQINWVSLGYSLYEAYYNLLQKYPDISQITNYNLHQKPSERSYTWLDDKPTWYTCSQQEMEMHYDINPDLLGGMQIRIGDRVVDSSIQTKLNQLQKELLGLQV